MRNAQDISFKPSAPDFDFLGRLLELFNQHLARKKEEVDFNKIMLKAGTKANLVSDLEGFAKDPVNKLNELRGAIDDFQKAVLANLTRQYLLSRKDIIQNAIRTQTHNDDLHYSIVLKEDSTENRNTVYSFLNEYELTGVSGKYPIYFQFLPAFLFNKMPLTESII